MAKRTGGFKTILPVGRPGDFDNIAAAAGLTICYSISGNPNHDRKVLNGDDWHNKNTHELDLRRLVSGRNREQKRHRKSNQKGSRQNRHP